MEWRSVLDRILLISADAIFADGIKGGIDRIQGIGDAFD